MVHIQRSCLTYLGQDHKSIDGILLRAIAMTICRINTMSQKRAFYKRFYVLVRTEQAICYAV